MDSIEKIKLTNGDEVTLKTTPLTWRERETLKYATFGSFNEDKSFNPEGMVKAQIKGIELMIVEIKRGESVILFSKEWIDSLCVVDGEALTDAIDKIHDANSKKKELANPKS